MERENKVERSELFHKIFDKVKELPRAKVEGDAVDHSSLSYTLEQLFLEEFEKRKIGSNMDEIRSGCPCLYLKEPCQPNCTCVKRFMSNGCLNCATYGSLEQRTAMAEYLNMIRLKGEDCAQKEEQAKDKK